MREDLSRLSDDEVFAAARESRSVLRRLLCYSATGWLGIALLPAPLGFAHVYTTGRGVFLWLCFVFGLFHLAALPGLRTAPAAWTRIAGVLLAPFVWPATRSRRAVAERGSLARHRALLVEAGRRLDRDPEGEAQRRWLEGG